MSDRYNSILPGNFSELERQLESLEQRITDLNITIEQLWDPWHCPVAFLPYLAWAVSVDVWESSWPEETKRAAIFNAPELHRIKGTPKAVKLALTQLGFDYDYAEWWEHNPTQQKGTFSITAYINNNLGGENELLGAKTLALVKKLIDKNKRGTAHYTLNLGLGLNGPLDASGALEPVRGDLEQTVAPPPVPVSDIPGNLSLIGQSRSHVDADIAVNPTLQAEDVTGRLTVSGSLYQYQTLDLTLKLG